MFTCHYLSRLLICAAGLHADRSGSSWIISSASQSSSEVFHQFFEVGVSLVRVLAWFFRDGAVVPYMRGWMLLSACPLVSVYNAMLMLDVRFIAAFITTWATECTVQHPTCMLRQSFCWERAR
jgi:hypothetical protein